MPDELESHPGLWVKNIETRMNNSVAQGLYEPFMGFLVAAPMPDCNDVEECIPNAELFMAMYRHAYDNNTVSVK